MGASNTINQYDSWQKSELHGTSLPAGQAGVFQLRSSVTIELENWVNGIEADKDKNIICI